VALSHLDDLKNAKAVYKQALQLDQKDLAIPLNYASLLFRKMKNNLGAGAQLKVL
jgi:hypothetical protein